MSTNNVHRYLLTRGYIKDANVSPNLPKQYILLYCSGNSGRK